MADSFTILGSSSGLPQADRACSGYCLETAGRLSLIDCGGGVTSSFLRCGFDPFKVDRIFISHTHSDHVGELPLFIQMLHVMRRTEPLTVYLPDEFVRPFEAWLDAVYLLRQRLPFDLKIVGYSDRFVYDEQFRLTAIGNSHHGPDVMQAVLESNLPNQGQCHSFRIDVGEKSLFYSADIGSFADIREHLHDLTYAIVESTHVAPDELIEYARKSSVDQYIITHLGKASEIAEITRLIAESRAINISLAVDGLRLTL